MHKMEKYVHANKPKAHKNINETRKDYHQVQRLQNRVESSSG
jgi:hypothetical protein